MHRRDYIRVAGLVGLTAVAGCAGDNTEDADVAAATTTTTQQADQTSTTTTTETEPETDTEPETPAGTPEVTIGEHELVIDAGEYTTDVYVAATVRNEGNAPSGSVELTAKWYDADGNYLNEDSWFLQSLGAGETWAARVYYLGGNAENIDDYEFSGEYGTAPPKTNPEGLAVGDTEMEIGETEVVITGTVTNNRDEAAAYIEATTKIYDRDGVVLGDEWTNVSDLPAGETWAFEIAWLGWDRVEQAADHTVWITDSAI